MMHFLVAFSSSISISESDRDPRAHRRYNSFPEDIIAFIFEETEILSLRSNR